MKVYLNPSTCLSYRHLPAMTIDVLLQDRSLLEQVQNHLERAVNSKPSYTEVANMVTVLKLNKAEVYYIQDHVSGLPHLRGELRTQDSFYYTGDHAKFIILNI